MGDRLCPSQPSSRSPNLSFAVHESLRAGQGQDKGRISVSNWKGSGIGSVNNSVFGQLSLHHPHVCTKALIALTIGKTPFRISPQL